MTGIWWTSASIEIFLCSLTATTAHLLTANLAVAHGSERRWLNGNRNEPCCTRRDQKIVQIRMEQGKSSG